MSFPTKLQRPVATLAVCALLAACASPNAPGGMAASENPCSVGKSVLIGAGVGALIGGLTGGKEGVLKGAAGGAALGALACVAINSKQTKTATEADRDYQRTNKYLPPEPKVISYSAQINSPAAKRGEPIKVTSELELVNGSNQKVSQVREELVILDPKGEPFKSGGKPFLSTSAGRFENSFELTLPSNAPQGVYSMKTNVFVNGALMASRNLQTQVVWNGDTAIVVAAR